MTSAFDQDGIASTNGGDGAASPEMIAAAYGSEVDTGTIAWLLPEIVSAFDAATSSLRAFRAGAAGVDRADVDFAPLRVARSHLHQAHGALELGELAGVTKVTEAIEEFLALFENEPERCDAIALDAIIGSCRAIVEYLEDLQGGAPQQPLLLFPSYSELLGARGADRIHPADLFMVDLGIRPPRDDSGVALDNAGLNDERSAFEQALLRYIRNENDTSALVELSKAVTAIDASVAKSAKVGHSQQRAFWWVTRALFDALANDGFAKSKPQHAHLKRLAGRVNLQIRKLVDGSNAVAERLFADTLFFVAIAEPVTPHVRDVQWRYRLVNAVPPDYESQRYGRIDASVLKTARDALAAAKTSWSAVVAGDVNQIRSFAKESSALLDAVGAIKRRGLAQVAHVIDGIATDLGFDPRQPPAAVGLDVATALLFLEGSLGRARLLDDAFDARAAIVVARVEASALGQEHATPIDWFDRMSREAEERQTVATFVVELQANLRSAEKVLDAFFRDPAERAGLKEAHTALAQVSGALALLGHEDVHQAIDRARQAIELFQQQDGPADPAAAQSLAQSLGAVGFYVEQIKRQRIEEGAFHFDPASGTFNAAMIRPQGQAEARAEVAAPEFAATLVMPVEPEALDPTESAIMHANAADAAFSYTDFAFAAKQVIDMESTLEDEIARRAGDAKDHATRLLVEPNNHAVRDELAAAIDEVRRNAALIDDRALQDEAAKVLGDLRSAGHDPLSSAAVAQLADQVADLATRANRSAGIEPPPVAPAEPRVALPAEDKVDAELLEIFLEEGSGVLVDAEASMRVLDADPLNTTATVNLRRGFHTLKGSSRMVGLFAFGEAAWSIEDTLNGHIADQGAASSDLRALIDYAIRYLNDWLQELSATGGSSRIPDALIEAARAVRGGTSALAAMPVALEKSTVESANDATHDAIDDAANESAPAHEDDFLKTVFIPSRSHTLDDLHFAATQVLGDDPQFAATQIIGDDPVGDLEFFGMQPTMRESDVAAGEPFEPEAELPVIEGLPVDGPHDEAAAHHEEPVAHFDAIDPADGVEAHDDTITPVFHVDAPTEPVAVVDEPVDHASEDSLISHFVFDESHEHTASEGETTVAATPDVSHEPTEHVDEIREHAETIEASASIESSHASDNVLPFAMPTPTTAPRTDDVRRIGPLTLSVALFNIYLAEADELLRVLTQDFAEWRHELDRYVSESAMRAAHSLAGSSATVGLTPAHDLASGIEDVLQALWREPVVLNENQIGRLQEAVETLRKMLHRFAAERMPDPEPIHIAALLSLLREIGVSDATPPSVATEPTDAVAPPSLPFEPLDFGDEPVTAVDEESTPSFEQLTAEVTPEDVVHHDEVVAANDIIELLPIVDEPISTESADDVFASYVGPNSAPDDFDALATIDAGDMPFDDEASIDEAAPTAFEPVASETTDEIERFVETPATHEFEPVASDEAHADMPAFAHAADHHDASHEEAHHESIVEAEAHREMLPLAAENDALLQSRRVVASERESNVKDDIDPDLLEVFVAEGGEILPQIGTLLRTWQNHRDNSAPSRMLLRHLHTLKGSARMAGAMRLGEVVHDIEARVESAARLHEVPAPLLDELLAAHDRSLELFDYLQNPGSEAAATAAAVAVDPATTDASGEAIVDVQPGIATGQTLAEVATQTKATTRGRDQKQASQQAVRVNSETLDRLVNLAGEVSISRARIENEVLQIKGAMADLSENVERLRAQLREIELQAEFQMQSQMQSQQGSGQEREKFDPLEFDRFTRFQELTRMMAESVNDVKTVQLHLQKSLDVAETDLALQRRMTRDLQQDLMQVRMVPFGNIAERLYRVARRSAKEVGKRVNLDVRGGTVEIDRSVLERMAGPFEHLLRNHIVHGIESRDVRRQSGKDETGELLVEVRQEGNEIVLTFSDDGAGLNYERIRTKGRELGLIGDGDISDADAAELIFHPGFSTASEITELAGRGVGMDVVRAEALELGGRVSVDSEAGKGSRFTITLPLTLAVTQVVLVSVASRVYALPAVLVEQVQQLRPQPLADAYRAGELTWAGAPVRLAFLGTLLGIDESVPVAQRVSPVLILRSAGERIAVHVDEVVGNQEVVVKNLGPQLARMAGIAGATVLGSGEIVLILNPVQLAQMAKVEAPREVVAPAVESEAPVMSVKEAITGLMTLPTVMVVDDSLTVRRVTQRLLSREGYQVVLAKDGVDALEQLQDFPPDVMLVDIEMPRMDGFDLTRNVRNDERYKHIPIIMITSRTAEKHRRHAAELGVDAYLGKPYQEDELLELLTMHVRSRRGHPA
jgi:chemosensory pili system protein ChpA (sensor histidine kinase/response regulator)